jgi:hypothetical protein
VVVLSVAVELWWPGLFSMLGKKLEADGEIWKYMPTLTIGLAVYSFNLSSKIRAPLQDDSNRVLYEWPVYKYLVDRVYISMGYCVVAALGSLVLWLIGKGLNDDLVGLIFISATAMASATAITMLLSKQKLVEILVSLK